MLGSTRALETRADEQPPHPGVELVRFTEARQRPPGLDECILDRVLGGVLVAEDHPRDRGESPDRLRGELREGVLIATSSPDHQIAHCSPSISAATCRRCQ